MPGDYFRIRRPAQTDEQYRPSGTRDRHEVGRTRAGRLVADDEGFGPDLERELVSHDVGIDGGGASAEEAAMHVIDDD